MPERELGEHEVKIFTVEFKGHKSPRSFRFKLSDASIDYDNDSIDPKGWDLTNFRAAGGPVMFGHDYKSLPIAKDIGAKVEGDSLYGIPQFPEPGIHPFADTVYELIKDGFLNAASVGFKPKEHTYNPERKGFDISKSTLLEYSIVPIGAHPGALVQRARQKHLDIKPLEEWCVRYLDETYGAPCVAVTRDQVEKVFQFITASKTFQMAMTLGEEGGVPKGTTSSSCATGHMMDEDMKRDIDGLVLKPKPKDGEGEKDYIKRCMGDGHMNDKFPDQAQRYAVCQSIYQRGEKELTLEITEPEEEKFLELTEDVVQVDLEQLTAAIGQAFKEGLTEAITTTVRERLDYARGRVA